jgi:hypothetical protein
MGGREKPLQDRLLKDDDFDYAEVRILPAGPLRQFSAPAKFAFLKVLTLKNTYSQKSRFSSSS